jgi:hypothetical protein
MIISEEKVRGKVRGKKWGKSEDEDERHVIFDVNEFSMVEAERTVSDWMVTWEGVHCL